MHCFLSGFTGPQIVTGPKIKLASDSYLRKCYMYVRPDYNNSNMLTIANCNSRVKSEWPECSLQHQVAFFTIYGTYQLFYYSFKKILSHLLKAARLSAACNSLRKLGHEIKVRPFGWQDEKEEELDSFLMFQSSLSMKVRSFSPPSLPLPTLLRLPSPWGSWDMFQSPLSMKVCTSIFFLPDFPLPPSLWIYHNIFSLPLNSVMPHRQLL